ncbi:DUF4126 domain-containing protein [Spiractinospora alimapuensis]|uniref:DUF4126 domain-containing protein n=1 Tax=Spiractinospora alimapuensis TaxID=2820884 RepID=UPI001F256CA9|nr:DUF4126 domain-containing protein [Spiractinospora alimapuensis]QVQ54267.1 DUF4126 domain-containing protein [Spiractinospora alimapuensis]
MLTVLTGTGLSAAAGLNAYLPLLIVGLIARYTDWFPLAPGWQWLEHPATLGVLAVLMLVEFLADKFPVVDSVNDAIQTVVRPTSGGISFGAGVASISFDDAIALDPANSAASGDGSVWPIVAGVVIAFAVHVVKSLARPVINTVTVGIGGPVTSFVEDLSSLTLTVCAILIPLAVLLFLPVLALFVVWLVRARKRRKRAKAEAAPGDVQNGAHYDPNASPR